MTTKTQCPVRWALVTGLVREMRQRSIPATESHIQRYMFLLQELQGTPTGHKFIFYKHAPYSFDLNDDLGRMRANLILDIELLPGHGANFTLGRWSERCIDEHENLVEPLRSHVDLLARHLGGETLQSLERVSTALHVMTKNPSGSRSSWTRAITGLTPQVSPDDAWEALDLLAAVRESTGEKD